MKISYCYSDQINKNLEKKIIKCFEKTFSIHVTKNYFKWKFIKNPFGKSLHIIVSKKKKIIASRVLWRFDINNLQAYQCVDTSVLPNYQRLNIFTKTSNIASNLLKKKIIYNSPNKKSGPAYKKCGWKQIKNSNKIKINFTYLMIKSAPDIKWSKKILQWRFENNPINKYYILRKNNYYYIFSKKKFFFLLVGKTKFKLNLKNINPFICISFDNSSKGITIRNRQHWMFKSPIKNINEVQFYSYLFDTT